MKRCKRCFVLQCLSPAPFASPSQPDVHACENHKKRDFVNMRNKRCLAKGCYRNPHYGVSRLVDPNSKAQYCTEHKAPGMQNVNGGRCAGPDCSKQPRFSLPGEKGKYCSKHREEGMVDVLYTPCAAEGCKKHPHFGFVEGGARYCAQHRADGMVDVKHRRCAIKGCRKDRIQITAGTRRRGKFCEMHAEQFEDSHATAQGQAMSDQEGAASSEGTTSDSKRARMWKIENEDDREYMSSEGSQRGSSVGDAGSLSFENPPADVRMLCRHESTYSQSHRLQRTEDARGHLYTRAAAPQGESHVFFERVGVSPHYSTTTSVREGASDGELTDRGDVQSTTSNRLREESDESDPYPLYQQKSNMPSNVSPETARAATSGWVDSRHRAYAPAPCTRPFRLLSRKPSPTASAENSWYPCPWEFTRERQILRFEQYGSQSQGPRVMNESRGYPPASF